MSKNSLSADIAIEGRTVGVMHDLVYETFHSRASLEFFRNDKVIIRLYDWVRHRFETLMLEPRDQITIELNRLNERRGLGLQIATLCARRPRRFRLWLDPEDRLLLNELRHPSIAIVTSGLVDGSPKSCLIDFNGRPGSIQMITALSSDFRIGLGDAPITGATPLPNFVEPGESLVVPFPLCLRTIVQKNVQTSFSYLVRETTNAGVYVREILKTVKT